MGIFNAVVVCKHLSGCIETSSNDPTTRSAGADCYPGRARGCAPRPFQIGALRPGAFYTTPFRKLCGTGETNSKSTLGSIETASYA